jgi:acetoacetate decarboxylase/enoyl-ACP reductase-like protein
MKHETVRASAFAMPLTNPAFPSGPYRFVNREYFIIQYRTDPEALRRIVPEPLALTEPVVNYEFIRMPDSTGFGDYTGISQKEASEELLSEKQPSLDFASPEQLGGTVAFLCSAAADQITGTAISVDGGWTAR